MTNRTRAFFTCATRSNYSPKRLYILTSLIIKLCIFRAESFKFYYRMSSYSHDSHSDDDSWDETDAEEMEKEPTKCLFCNEIEESIEKAIQHLYQQHSVNLSDIKRKFNLDQYSYIKMINYIKTHNITAEHFVKIKEVLWSDDKYMKPVEVDAWLMFDIEDFPNECQSNDDANHAHRIESLQQQLEEKDVLIEQLLEQINQMKSGFHEWVDRTANSLTTVAESTERNFPAPAPAPESAVAEQTHVAEIPISQDEPYFIAYSHFGIHFDMLSDSVRTNSYREAILQNRISFNNKNVLDVGCGSAILSMFSSQAGAKKVFAVDQSEIIYFAMDIAHRNDIKNVEFVKGRLENMELPLAAGESVDIIVSEWMGYFLLFEGMLDSVIHARDKYLKPGGLLLPNRCNINLMGLGDEERHSEYIGFWTDVYGYDMSALQKKVLQEAVVENARHEHVLTEAVVIADFNLLMVDYTYPNFKHDFMLKIKKSGKFTAFVGYFDTFFDLPQRVEFTTSPHATPTHWKQVIFYLKNPVPVNEGDNICGQFQCNRGKSDARAISVKITAFDQDFFFNLN
ncbi:uncharacterized protein LOC129573066 [Sitodiplosis mosellana]|uniref:uncharacterized protein LOC129573066 n=1 Tax=Sitodiplosis mosellana TaxID=263140 RepID=UPI002444A777|nr:uncharacterized protein LOC129573066 [Sitodiplosis mosellana]